MNHIKDFNKCFENIDGYIKKESLLNDIKERMDMIQSQMEILKDNTMYSYALSKMYTLLEELRLTYSK